MTISIQSCLTPDFEGRFLSEDDAMSRNFELLQQAGWDEGIFSEPADGNPKPVAERRPSTPWQRQASTPMAQFIRRVFINAAQPTPKVAVFCGLNRKVGCSATCAAVTRSLTDETGQSVCAVDANSFSPGLHLHFETSNQPGLSDSLLFGRSPKTFAVQVTPESNSWLLTYGQQKIKAHSLGGSRLLRSCIDHLRNQFDFVLIDVPALCVSSDALGIARHSDGVILVAESRHTSASEASSAKSRFRRANIPLLGVIMTN